MKKKFFSLVLAVITIMSCMMFIACSPKAENPITYTVTFDSVGGTAVASQTVEKDKYVQRPQDPTKADDVFYYWYLDTQNNMFDFQSTKITKNITLKARWASDPVLYRVVYKVGNEEYCEQEIGREGYYATKPTNPTKTNSTFVYWCLEGKDDPFIFDQTPISKHISLNAKFISGDLQDGQIMFYLGTLTGATVGGISASQQKISANAGDVVSFPKLTPPDSHDFLGWVNATTGEKYLISDYPNISDYNFTYDGSALVMYAIWE